MPSGVIVRIRLLQTAKTSLDKAMTYIAEQEGEEAAKKLYVYIRTQIDNLLDHPYRGRTGQVSGTRELVIGKYPFIIPYRVKDGELQILDVFHTSRKPPKSW